MPTRNLTEKTTVDVIFNNFIVNYGLPQKLHSDQVPNFCSNIIKELCQLTVILKFRTTPCQSMGNELTERFNRTMISMLGTLDREQKHNWKNHINPLVYRHHS